MRRKRGQVVGVMVHIVAVGGLGGTTVAAAIMGDYPIAAIQKEQHLVIPVVRAERPTMAENYRLSLTPVLVVNLYTVFGRDGGHKNSMRHRGKEHVARWSVPSHHHEWLCQEIPILGRAGQGAKAQVSA